MITQLEIAMATLREIAEAGPQKHDGFPSTSSTEAYTKGLNNGKFELAEIARRGLHKAKAANSEALITLMSDRPKRQETKQV